MLKWRNWQTHCTQTAAEKYRGGSNPLLSTERLYLGTCVHGGKVYAPVLKRNTDLFQKQALARA